MVTRLDQDGATAPAAAVANVPTFGYRPALDGLRALAVMLVLAFHAGFGWIRGGYVGVSIFFTLSGFLITSVTVGEVRRSGALQPLGFVARRFKRLMPATLLCLTLVAIAHQLGEYPSTPAFGHELRAAMFSFFNWTRALGDHSYVQGLAATGTHQSPLEHFWSLSVEEQYYLLWPFAVAAVVWFAVRRGRHVERSLTAVVVALTLAAAVAAPVIATVGGSQIGYWATPVRAVEILVGACLALLFARRPLGRHADRLALVALAVLVACAIWLPAASGPAYSGWMAPIAVASAVLIRGLTGPSPLTRVFAARPLVAVGKISFGIYLFHWPVFLLLRQHGWDLTSPPAFLAATTIVVAIAALSFRFVEQPVRHVSVPPWHVVAAGLAALAVAALAVPLVSGHRGFLEPDRRALAEASAANEPEDTTPLTPSTTAGVSPSTTTTATATATTTTIARTSPAARVVVPVRAVDGPAVATSTTTVPSAPFATDLDVPSAPARPVRVVTIGDSTAFYVGQALAQWAVAHPAYMRSDLVWCQGCGFMLDGTISGWDASEYVARSDAIVHDVIPARIAKLHPDVALLMVTIDDAADRQWSPDEGVLTPADPRFVERMTAAYTAVTDELLALGVPRVVWAHPPVPHWRGDPADMADQTRWAVMDGVIDAVAAAAGPRVGVVDIAGWAHATGLDDDPDWRPDGVHLTEDSAADLARRWLAPWLIDDATSTSTAG